MWSTGSSGESHVEDALKQLLPPCQIKCPINEDIQRTNVLISLSAYTSASSASSLPAIVTSSFFEAIKFLSPLLVCDNVPRTHILSAITPPAMEQFPKKVASPSLALDTPELL